MRFPPAIPTRGTKVPSSPEWIHESNMMASGSSFTAMVIAFGCSPAMDS
jgi:hypothetical protein